MIRRPPRSTLFPYTTLFRSELVVADKERCIPGVIAKGLEPDQGLGDGVRSQLGFLSNEPDRKSTRLNSSHLVISYAVFCLKKKNNMRSTLLVPSRMLTSTHS